MRKAIILAGFVLCATFSSVAQHTASEQTIKPVPYPDFNAPKVQRITKRQAIQLISSNTAIPHTRYEILINARVDVLPALKDDRSFLKPVFSRAKWEMIDWGSGNFEGGPRFSSMEFYKAGKYYAMFRKYSYSSKAKNGDYNMRLTEEFELMGN